MNSPGNCMFCSFSLLLYCFLVPKHMDVQRLLLWDKREWVSPTHYLVPCIFLCTHYYLGANGCHFSGVGQVTMDQLPVVLSFLSDISSWRFSYYTQLKQNSEFSPKTVPSTSFLSHYRIQIMSLFCLLLETITWVSSST